MRADSKPLILMIELYKAIVNMVSVVQLVLDKNLYSILIVCVGLERRC